MYMTSESGPMDTHFMTLMSEKKYNGSTSRDSFYILTRTQTPLASNINQKPVANNRLSFPILISVCCVLKGILYSWYRNNSSTLDF